MSRKEELGQLRDENAQLRSRIVDLERRRFDFGFVEVRLLVESLRRAAEQARAAAWEALSEPVPAPLVDKARTTSDALRCKANDCERLAAELAHYQLRNPEG